MIGDVVEDKIDKLTRLIEDMNESRLRSQVDHRHMFRDLILTTVCGSIIGYFLFKVLEIHLGHNKGR